MSPEEKEAHEQVLMRLHAQYAAITVRIRHSRSPYIWQFYLQARGRNYIL